MFLARHLASRSSGFRVVKIQRCLVKTFGLLEGLSVVKPNVNQSLHTSNSTRVPFYLTTDTINAECSLPSFTAFATIYTDLTVQDQHSIISQVSHANLLTKLYGSQHRQVYQSGCCQTNEPKHKYLVDGYFYEITKERHSVRAASRFSLNVLRFESDLCELNKL